MDSRAWDERYSGAELIWTAEPNRFLVAELSALPPGRALDLACGEGRNAVWLARRGWTVTGVDFSRNGLEKGRALAAHHDVEVEWVLADVIAHELPAYAFDLVVILYLHLARDDFAAVLEHAVDALAPGGTLLVVGHDITNPTDGYGGPQDTSVLYGPDDVVGSIGELIVEKAERVRRPVDTADGTVDAIDALVRAHARPYGEKHP